MKNSNHTNTVISSILTLLGSIRLLEKSYKEDYLPIETMLITLELLQHRLEHVFEIICERGVMDD